MSKTEIISLRLKNEELEALTSLPKNYGKTTSEKLRTLIQLAASGELKQAPQKEVELSPLEGSRKSEVLNFYQTLQTELNALHKNVESIQPEESEKKVIEELQYQMEKFLGLGLSVNPRVINNRYFLDSLLSLRKVFEAVEKFHTDKD